jgi:uncharacterized membrane protein YfcA
MEIFVISITPFLVAILTFFSGFGLGTILTPVFVVFFPVELAIALNWCGAFFQQLFQAHFSGS